MENMDIDKAIKKYLNNMTRTESPASTITAYKTDFNLFKKYITEEKNISNVEDIDDDDFLDYKDYLEQVKNFKSATVNRKLNALKSLFGYLHKLGIIRVNYMSVIPTKRPFQDQKKVEVLDSKEVEQIITLPNKIKDKNWKRSSAILYVLAFLGLRRSEVLELRVKHLNMQNRTLDVFRPKTRTFDALPLSDRTYIAIVNYLKERAEMNEEDYLFKGDKGGKLSETAFTEIIRRYAEGSNIKKEITAYSFRHTFITNLLEEGVDQSLILKWTGHTDIRSLEVYAHSTVTIKNRIMQSSFQTHNKNQIEKFLDNLYNKTEE